MTTPTGAGVGPTALAMIEFARDGVLQNATLTLAEQPA